MALEGIALKLSLDDGAQSGEAAPHVGNAAAIQIFVPAGSEIIGRGAPG